MRITGRKTSGGRHWRSKTGIILSSLVAIILPIVGLTGLARADQATAPMFSGQAVSPFVLTVVLAGFIAMITTVAIMFRKVLRDQARFTSEDL